MCQEAPTACSEPSTKTAVSDYQRWNGLPVSGVVDAATAESLGLSGCCLATAAHGSAGTRPAAPRPPARDPACDGRIPYVGLAQGARSEPRQGSAVGAVGRRV